MVSIAITHKKHFLGREKVIRQQEQNNDYKIKNLLSKIDIWENRIEKDDPKNNLIDRLVKIKIEADYLQHEIDIVTKELTIDNSSQLNILDI